MTGGTSVFQLDSYRPKKNVGRPSDFHQLTEYLIESPSLKWWSKITNRMKVLLNLEVGWDGYRGKPVSFENAIFALKVLETVCPNTAPEPQIVPGSNGDLQIEWHIHGVDIELDILAPNKVNFWISNAETGEEGKEVPLTTNFVSVADEMKKLSNHQNDQATAA